MDPASLLPARRSLLVLYDLLCNAMQLAKDWVRYELPCKSRLQVVSAGLYDGFDKS